MPSRQPDTVLAEQKRNKKLYGSGGIRTHASEETGALNQRLRPLGHATLHPQCQLDILPNFSFPKITITLIINGF